MILSHFQLKSWEVLWQEPKQQKMKLIRLLKRCCQNYIRASALKKFMAKRSGYFVPFNGSCYPLLFKKRNYGAWSISLPFEKFIGELSKHEGYFLWQNRNIWKKNTLRFYDVKTEKKDSLTCGCKSWWGCKFSYQMTIEQNGFNFIIRTIHEGWLDNKELCNSFP